MELMRRTYCLLLTLDLLALQDFRSVTLLFASWMQKPMRRVSVGVAAYSSCRLRCIPACPLLRRPQHCSRHLGAIERYPILANRYAPTIATDNYRVLREITHLPLRAISSTICILGCLSQVVAALDASEVGKALEGIAFVVDSMFGTLPVMDPFTGLEVLQLVPISQAVRTSTLAF